MKSAYALLVALFVSGCATQTRLGSLIPAHPNSQKSDGELVLLDFKPAENKQTPSGTKLVDIAASAALAVFDAAVGYLQSELKREALQYEATFSQKIGLTTQKLNPGTNKLYLTRWIDSKDTTSDSDYIRISNELGKEFFKEHEAEIKNKRLVYYLDMDLRVPENGQPPFTIAPQEIYLRQSKAKVVGLGLNDVWQVWRWLGAAVLKTDSKLRESVDIVVMTLGKTASNNVPVMVSIPPTGKLVADKEFDLDGATSIKLHGQPEVPLVLPANAPTASAKATTKADFTIEIIVKESDASNVPQNITDLNEYIDKNKSSWRSKLQDSIK